MDRCTDTPVITSAEWSLSTALCVSLPNQGVTFVIGPADPGSHTLNLFGENRKRTSTNFYIVLVCQKLFEVHHAALWSVVSIQLLPFLLTGVYKLAGIFE